MNDIQLTLTMLKERSTKLIAQIKDAQDFNENKEAARLAGSIAKASVGMKSIVILAALALGGTAANAEDISQAYGIGVSSCATWLDMPGRYFEGTAWLLGYWSATNIINPSDHSVGQTTDGAGIIGEVKMECQSHPSENFANAISATYRRLLAAHR